MGQERELVVVTLLKTVLLAKPVLTGGKGIPPLLR